MKRGTIVLTKFPFTDLSSAKRRPGMIVSNRFSANNDVIIAFISSVLPVFPEETDYVISSKHNDFRVTGLKKDSVVRLDKLATVNTQVISGEIGSVSNSTMEEINTCLKLALGLM